MSTLKLRGKSFLQVPSKHQVTILYYSSLVHKNRGSIKQFYQVLFAFYTFSDPKQQLQLAVKAVFDSWESPRAIKYRSINQITGLKGTAVNIQTMVFGNMGNTSGTGVLFTRNPSTGENKLYGEFLINAQV